jgi:N-methylhydantoinase B
MRNAAVRVDPVTLQVISHNLISIVDEMEANISRTAYSPIVYEVKDYCAALIAPDGQIIAQARGGMPIFLADLGTPVRAALGYFGLDGFEPGDLILCNDPYITGQHLNNVVAISPIFLDADLVGFAAVRAHWLDVGGHVPGSFATDTTDIFSEGIVLSCVKVIRGGREDAEMLRMVSGNIRFPAESFGDMRAQIAACRVGERRFKELLGKYGTEEVMDAVDHILDRSERAARRRLAETPDGIYLAESFLDSDGHTDDPVYIRVRAEVRGEELYVDLSQSSEQVKGNINCGTSAAASAVRVAFKSFTSPESPADEGSFRPLHVILPPGRFLSAQRPAGMTQWSACVPLLIDTVLKALSQADPSRVPAAHHGSLGPFIWVGQPPSSRPFVHIDTCSGGWGAGPNHDGGVGLKTVMHGDTFNVSIEVEEALYPLRVESYELVPDSGGAGQWRGGLSSAKTYLPLVDLSLNFGFERSKCRPWGREGGGQGMHNRLEILAHDGSVIATKQYGTLLAAPAGSRFAMISGSGGGYGPPALRARDAVRSDVREGYVSAEQARSLYGLEKEESG